MVDKIIQPITPVEEIEKINEIIEYKDEGVVDVNSGTLIKTWTGTKDEFDALEKDENTLYNVDDISDHDIEVPILEALYPVGSIYIGTQSTCPLIVLIPNSQWELVAIDRVLQGGGTRNAGSTVEAGLPNITGTANFASGGTGEKVAPLRSGNGVFSVANTAKYINGRGDDLSGVYENLQFNASRSNSIYGNSSTVQPPAFIVNIWKRTA